MPEILQSALGLAKAAPIPIKVEPLLPTEPQVEIEPAPQPSQTLSAPSWEGVPIDLIRYFGRDIGTMSTKDIEQLKDIDRWSRLDLAEDTIGNRLQKIRSLESRLGAPALYETKVQKLWNWVAMQKNIDELRKRQEAFER